MVRHQPCMILGLLIFKQYHFKNRYPWEAVGFAIFNPPHCEEVMTVFLFSSLYCLAVDF